MHWARFAPELSATVTMVLSWIMARSSRSPRPLDETEEAPPLVLGQRARLHEADDVSHAAFVLLVVHLELLPAAHIPAVRRVLHQPLDGHDCGLVHAVAHDLADTHLPAAPRDRRRRR